MAEPNATHVQNEEGSLRIKGPNLVRETTNKLGFDNAKEGESSTGQIKNQKYSWNIIQNTATLSKHGVVDKKSECKYGEAEIYLKELWQEGLLSDTEYKQKILQIVERALLQN